MENMVFRKENPDRWVAPTLYVTFIGKTESDVRRLLVTHQRRAFLPRDTEVLTSAQIVRFGMWRNGIWLPDYGFDEYFKHIRYPSRRWPYSYFKAVSTKKFVKWLRLHHPQLFMEN